MPGQSEFEDVLRELAQQQSALSQQQTALLQLQTESLRLQRLLIERAMGTELTDPAHTPVVPVSTDRGVREPVVEPSPPAVSTTLVERAEAAGDLHDPPSETPRPTEDSPFGEPPRSDPPNETPAAGTDTSGTLVVRSRAARYMLPTAVKPARPVSRLDVDRVTRLYETGDAAHLVLNFGEYRGATLLQVAQMDPDYVQQLALRAQRPEVRAAARQLVIALEQVAAHAPRTARQSRRPRATG